MTASNSTSTRMRIIAFALFLFFPGARLWSQAEPLTLRQAIEIALENNYAILVSRNDAAVADNNASLGNAGFLPTLDATGSKGKTVFDTRQEFASGDVSERDGAETTALQGAVNLRWTIFDGFNMFTSMKQLNALKDIGELEARAQIENTVADVIAGYSNILQQRQLLESLRDAIAISKERAQIAEAQYRIGSGSRLEWNRAKVDMIADSSAFLRQDTDLTNAKYEFNRLLARDSELPFVATDSINIRTDLTLASLASTANNANKDMQIAEKDLRLARLRLSEVRSEYLPVVSLNLGYSYSRTESNAGFFLFNRNRNLNYGVSATWNLFNGFNTRRAAQNAKLDMSSRELDLRDVRSAIETELAKQYKRYQVSLELVRLERENEQLARDNVGIALEQYRLGSITSVDLREVQNTFIDSEARFLAAQLEAKLAETELLRLGGQLIQ